jgi:hypothetical protein
VAAGEDHRQGQLAVAQVLAARLAGLIDAAGVVEDIVGDLEGVADLEAVAVQGGGDARLDEAAEARAPGDQRGVLRSMTR